MTGKYPVARFVEFGFINALGIREFSILNTYMLGFDRTSF
jgi:hypothetical protein